LVLVSIKIKEILRYRRSSRLIIRVVVRFEVWMLKSLLYGDSLCRVESQ